MRPLLLILLLCLPAAAVLAQAPPDETIQISIEKLGPVRVVDTTVYIPATPAQTWAVLTDWDNLSSFMHTFKAISIVSRSSKAVRMKQTVRASFWPFYFDVELDQELALFPEENLMQSRLLGGDFDSLGGTIRLVTDGSGTKFVAHTEFVPKFWIPPLFGPMIMERKMRQQFQDIIDEIARRNAAAKAVPDDRSAR